MKTKAQLSFSRMGKDLVALEIEIEEVADPRSENDAEKDANKDAGKDVEKDIEKDINKDVETDTVYIQDAKKDVEKGVENGIETLYSRCIGIFLSRNCLTSKRLSETSCSAKRKKRRSRSRRLSTDDGRFHRLALLQTAPYNYI